MSKITIKDIAKYAGVSQATVSRVINNSGYIGAKTRELVNDAILNLEYIPNANARNLITGESSIIGLVIPDIVNPFFGKILKGITSVLEKERLHLILCDTDENPKTEQYYLNMLREQRLKGLLITPTSDTDDYNTDLLTAMSNSGIPIVLIDRDVKYSNFDGVFIDNEKGSIDAVNAFIQSGHQRIAIISGPVTSVPGRKRLAGYKAALAMNKIPVDEELIFFGDFKLESGYKLTKEMLLLRPRPTALFVCNNLMNLGAIKALTEEGIGIGKDISLIGFDEIDILDALMMNISVVARPTKEMGKEAALMLLDRINKSKNVSIIRRNTLLPKLVLKGSEKLES